MNVPVQPAVQPVAVAQPAVAVTPAVTPAVAPAAPVVAPVAPVEPDRPPWYVGRIGELTAEGRARQDRIIALEAELAAERTARAAPAPSAAPVVGVVPAASQQASVAANEAELNRRATEIAAAQVMNRDADVSYNVGKAKYTDFDTKLGTFRMLGGIKPETLQAAIATGVGHDVLYELGSKPDEAARIMSLPPMAMAVEIAKIGTRLAPAVAAPPAPPASGAPAPIVPVTSAGATRVPDGLGDDVPDSEWFTRRDAALKAKRTVRAA